MSKTSAADALRYAAVRLAAVSDTPRLDAELLMAHAAGEARGELLLRLRDLAVPEGFAALVERRLAHEPVSHITGRRAFWTLDLSVTLDVLTPRPDTETLMEAAVAHFQDTAGPRRILDLGTGSGALLLAALDQWRQATGVGIDISTAALKVARANAERCGLSGRAEFRHGDWFAGIDERFDLILTNPPYIRSGTTLPPEVAGHEPHGALFAGADGLDAYRAIAPGLAARLAAGGLAAIEIGFDQQVEVSRLFAEQGLTISVLHDLGGRPRCITAVQPGIPPDSG